MDLMTKDSANYKLYIKDTLTLKDKFRVFVCSLTDSVYKVSDIFISECSFEYSVQLSSKHQ